MSVEKLYTTEGRNIAIPSSVPGKTAKIIADWPSSLCVAEGHQSQGHGYPPWWALADWLSELGINASIIEWIKEGF